MSLDIAFVNDVEAVLVAKLVEDGIVRIVGGADAVDVMLFHHNEVGRHILERDGVAVLRVGIVTVDALELDGRAVDEELALAADGNAAEADLLFDVFFARLDDEGVEVGRFRGPELGVFHVERGKLGLSVKDLRLDLDGLADEGAGDGNVAAHTRADVDIVNVVFGTGDQVDGAEDTVVTEAVLVLDIGSVAVGEDGDGDIVFADLDEVGEVEFRSQMCALGHTDVLAVHVNEEHGAYAVEHDVMASLDVCHVKRSVIDADGGVHRNVGRHEGDRISVVCVLDLSVAVALPAGGDGHGIRVGNGGHILGDLGDRFVVTEIPDTVEGTNLAHLFTERVGGTGNIVRARGHSVFARQSGCDPFVCVHERFLSRLFGG